MKPWENNLFFVVEKTFEKKFKKKNDVKYKRREIRVGCNTRVGFTIDDSPWIIFDYNTK